VAATLGFQYVTKRLICWLFNCSNRHELKQNTLKLSAKIVAAQRHPSRQLRGTSSQPARLSFTVCRLISAATFPSIITEHTGVLPLCTFLSSQSSWASGRTSGTNPFGSYRKIPCPVPCVVPCVVGGSSGLRASLVAIPSWRSGGGPLGTRLTKLRWTNILTAVNTENIFWQRRRDFKTRRHIDLPPL